MWQKICSIVFAVLVIMSLPLFPKEEKECCLCNSFRYHAPCLVDLETGELIELDLYFPHETMVAELADPQPEMPAFSFVKLGNVTGEKMTDTKTISLRIPNDKTDNPALCRKCKKLLPFGYSGRYILADLYGTEEKTLIPIKANKSFSLRCYDITTGKNTKKDGISLTVQGTLQ